MVDIYQSFKDALEEAHPQITYKYLIATTTYDGYTGTRPGGKVFKVLRQGDEYFVVELLRKSQGGKEYLTDEGDVIIFTQEDQIFFSTRTMDPYDFAYTEHARAGTTKERAVLNAFRDFVIQNYTLGGGAYHNLVDYGFYIADAIYPAVTVDYMTDIALEKRTLPTDTLTIEY